MSKSGPARAFRGTRLLPVLLGVTLVLGSGALYYYRTTKVDPGSIQWSCVPESDRTATCQFRVEDGGKAGSICFTMVLDCRDGMHKARVCSGTVTPGNPVTVPVTGFEPAMPADASCQPPRFLDRQVNRDD